MDTNDGNVGVDESEGVDKGVDTNTVEAIVARVAALPCTEMHPEGRQMCRCYGTMRRFTQLSAECPCIAESRGEDVDRLECAGSGVCGPVFDKVAQQWTGEYIHGDDCLNCYGTKRLPLDAKDVHVGIWIDAAESQGWRVSRQETKWWYVHTGERVGLHGLDMQTFGGSKSGQEIGMHDNEKLARALDAAMAGVDS